MQHIFYDWFGLNQILFTQINSISNSLLYQYFCYILSIIFALFVFLIYYGALVFYRYYCVRKSGFDYAMYNRYFDELVKIGSSYGAIGLIYTAMKFSINMARPYCSGISFTSIMDFAGQRCLSSFPSAHTAIAVLIYYSFLPYLNSLGRFLGLMMILVVGMSRIALAMHFPADIVYSIIIAFSICYLADKLVQIAYVQSCIVLPTKQFIFKQICH